MQKRFKAASKYFQKNKNCGYSNYGLALILLREKRLLEASELAIKSLPKSAGMNLFGVVNKIQGNLEVAEKSFNEASQIDQNSHLSFANLAKLLQRHSPTGLFQPNLKIFDHANLFVGVSIQVKKIRDKLDVFKFDLLDADS